MIKDFLKIFLLSAISVILQPIFFTKVFADKFYQPAPNEHFYVRPSHKNLEQLHEASTLVISCVDFRTQDELERFLVKELGLQSDYDLVSLPGASLAFVEKKYKSWGVTISDTIDVLKKLHKIKRIVFVDHMNCGAYKLIKGPALVTNPESEYKQHVKTLKEAKNKVKALFPDLEVYSFVMFLDGHIEHVD
jgi:hypothetical protein